MKPMVTVKQWVKSYEKDPNDPSHIGWLAHFQHCDHVIQFDPYTARIRTSDGSLPLVIECSECTKIAEDAVIYKA